MRIAPLSIALLALCAASLPATAGGVFNPVQHKLENGLTVVVMENHRAPAVTQIVWYRVGAMDEPPGKSGLAHFVEHLMFKKTKTLESGEFSAVIARNGGNENAFTTADVTGYYVSLAADRLELAMQMEADRMAALNPTAAEAQTERDVILDERRIRVEDDPAALLRERAAAALHPSHPYRNPIIGWEHELRSLTLEDAKKFHAAWYAPNNAVLVVTGDVDSQTVFALAEKHFGPLPPRAVPKRIDWRDPPPLAESLITLRDPRVREPAWARRWRAPSYGDDEGGLIYGLQLLADILGGDAGRLSRSLVAERQLAVSAGAWYDPDHRGPGEFGLYAVPRDGVDMTTLTEAMEREIHSLLENGVTEEEIETAKQRLQDSAVFARDSLSGPAWIVGMGMAMGRTAGEIESWPEHIEGVDRIDVERAAAMLLGGDGFVTTRLLAAEGGN